MSRMSHSNISAAADIFTDAYYACLQNARHAISSYYVPKETLPDGKQIPGITWNGNALEDAMAFQKMFENDMPFTHFEVQSLDCHILNPSIPTASNNPKEVEKSFSILIVVSGLVRLEEPKNGPLKGFTETLVLAPNRDKANKKGPRRDWLIQNQNFRYVV